MEKEVRRLAKSKYEKFIQPNLEIISGFAKKGIPEEEIAKHFKIAYSTFRKYKSEHEELQEALSLGNVEANAILSGVLFETAKGFYKDITKAIKIKKSEYKDGKKVKEWEEIEYVAETQYFPPNMGAIAFWLTNHECEKYSKNPKTEISGADGGVVMLAEVNDGQ